MAVWDYGPAQTYATPQAAADALFVSVGVNPFIETQYIRGYAGTYSVGGGANSRLEPNTGLNPTAAFRLIIDRNGTDVVIIDGTGMGWGSIGVAGIDYVTVDGMRTIYGVIGILVYDGSSYAVVQNCRTQSQGYGIYMGYGGSTDLYIVDCETNQCGTGVNIVDTASDIVIERVRCNGGNYGMYIITTAVTTINITSCVIRNVGTGIYVSGGTGAGVNIASSNNAIIRNCVLESGSSYAATIANSTDASILHCTCSPGPYFTNSPNGSVKNCILSGGVYEGWVILVDASSTSGFVSDYNAFGSCPGANVGFWNGVWYSSIAAWKVVSGQDANSIELQFDETFFNDTHGRTDYHLNAASACRGAGLAGVCVDDFDGEARDPANPDIGADEYNPAYGAAGGGGAWVF
jgi:hypothetical protein